MNDESKPSNAREAKGLQIVEQVKRDHPGAVVSYEFFDYSHKLGVLIEHAEYRKCYAVDL